MIPMDAVYTTAKGALVEVTVQGHTYRGEFYLEKLGDKPKETDQIILMSAVEHPSGKKLNGEIQFDVGNVQNFRVVELGLFRKKRDADDCLPPVPLGVNPYTAYQHQNTIHSIYGHGTVKQRYNKNTRNNNGGLTFRNVCKGKIPDELKEFEPIEIQLKTFVIKELNQLKVLMKLMKEVDICGLSLEGENIGRYGKVPWVVMTARKTLLPFDIETLLETIPDVWQILERNIFSNDKLVKIMHDGRRASDYLFHVHKIKLVNVYDTQVADTFIVHQQTGTVPDKLKSLSDCLTMYNRRIPPEEIEFLRKYEAVDFTLNSPFRLRPLPPPEYLKLSAIKVKHLVPLRENMMKKMLERFSKCVDTHLEILKHRSADEYPFAVEDLDDDEDSASRLDFEVESVENLKLMLPISNFLVRIDL